MKEHKCPRVVIIGAGFGGLWATRVLASSPVEVLLIDRHNYHTFLPLLYQVAAAEIEPEEIAYPVRSILRKLPNVLFAMAEVKEVNLAARMVKSERLANPYDFLVLATGSATHFFGVPGAAEHAFPLKTQEQGIALRNHILCRFEHAAHDADPERRRQMLTFTIIGGGPTGVEFAGALAELIRGPLTRDYPTMDFSEVRIVLLEAADTPLPSLQECCRAYALARLRRMGVEVRLQAKVSKVLPGAVRLKDGTVIPTETVVWTAGVRGNSLGETSGLKTARNGQVVVRSTLQVPDHPEVYIIGDLAYVEQGGHPLPMIAPVAIQQGAAVAQNIMRQIAGQDPLPFHYRDRGTMVTIGRNAAVAHFGGWGFAGFPAWVVWLSVHLFNLIGFRNRLFVLINWAWDYFFYERAVRLILPSEKLPTSMPERLVQGSDPRQ